MTETFWNHELREAVPDVLMMSASVSVTGAGGVIWLLESVAVAR